MMFSTTSLARFLILFCVFANSTLSHVIRHVHNASTAQSKLLPRAEKDPTDFTWVKNFAAIGDSYTAGIGSGAPLGKSYNNWKCSRFDQSYPEIIKNYLGTDVENFQFLACSGDRTEQIYEQAKKLEDNIDLLTLTAGGNDLCLAGIIKDCILLSFHGEATCETILKKAEGNLELIMRSNIKQILLALKDKMADDSIVVVNSYAQFFNTENDDCSKKQDWSFGSWAQAIWFDLDPPLPLTIERRKRFNKLTKGLNDLIREVVEEVQDEVNFTIGFSDWDLWGVEGVDGQMCHPSSSGAYPDEEQPDLLFFKPDTRSTIWKTWPLSVPEKRSLEGALPSQAEEARHANLPPRPPRDLDGNGVDREVYKSSLWNSPSPRAVALKQLDPRAPTPPSCPGDGDVLPSLGDFAPDFFGRIFHPNELGHNVIASYAVETAMTLRAKVLGVEPEICELTEEFKCWQKEGKKGYVTADRLDENYRSFCDEVEGPGEGAVGWSYKKTYHKGTPDEHELVFEMGDLGKEFSKKECLESFKRITHGCDGLDPENPLNWKFGGMWKRDQYTYTVNVKRTNRPWPLKEPYGFCEGDYQGSHSAYVIAGAGWASWDEGRDELLPSIKSCLGLGVSAWTFRYLDKPDKDGYEWYLGFVTPIWTNNRCFKNNKAVFGAGGFTDGCRGSGMA